MRQDRLRTGLAVTSVVLFVGVLIGNYLGVIERIREAAREAGTDLPNYMADNGDKVLSGVRVSLPAALNPVNVLTWSTVSFLLVLVAAVAVVYVWREAGAFAPGRPALVIWLSGALLPPLIGLAWIPVDFFFVVGPFMGLGNPEGFGVLLGEALWSGIWGLELAGVLSFVFVIARISGAFPGRHPESSPQPITRLYPPK